VFTIRGKLIEAAERYVHYFGLEPPESSTLSDEEQCQFRIERAELILDGLQYRTYILNGVDHTGKIILFGSEHFLRFHSEFWFGGQSPFLESSLRAMLTSPPFHMYSLSGAAVSGFI
jgi:hypothetical protein